MLELSDQVVRFTIKQICDNPRYFIYSMICRHTIPYFNINITYITVASFPLLHKNVGLSPIPAAAHVSKLAKGIKR